jgi:hypothetical protein
MADLHPDPVEQLFRHATLYHQDLPLFMFINSPPYWQCLYMGRKILLKGKDFAIINLCSRLHLTPVLISLTT